MCIYVCIYEQMELLNSIVSSYHLSLGEYKMEKPSIEFRIPNFVLTEHVVLSFLSLFLIHYFL